MNCRVCYGELETVLTLPDMPARAQNLPDEQSLGSDMGVTLDITQCVRCALVQLRNGPVSYWRSTIRTDLSQAMRDFRREQIARLKADWHVRTIIELGRYPQATTIEYDAFLMLDGLEHVPNPNELLSYARRTIPEGGIGLIEVPNFDMILKKNMVSEFMLDHLIYFTATTLRRALSINGFEVMEIKPVWHDYVLSATVKKRRKIDLSRMVMDTNPILSFIEGKTAAVWGAGHQALATLRLLNLDASKIKYVVDSSPSKHGRYTPVTHIPIVPPKTLELNPVEALVIMCGSYSEEVMALAKAYNTDVMIA